MPPGTFRSGRFLAIAARCPIADRHRTGGSVRRIAAELGRAPSTISRERARNPSPRTGISGPQLAQRLADGRLARPRTSKIAANADLRARIEQGRARRGSPEQISRWLKQTFPERPEMRGSHETIDPARYGQGRGALRRELRTCLRTGRAMRKRRGDHRRPRFATPPMLISERPPAVADRAVPGHGEGDLIIGHGNRSAIGTLVERTTRSVLLVHWPDRDDAEAVRDGLVQTIGTLPEHRRRSLTGDPGSEMTRHHACSIATGLPVYFCDPGAPWQRGSNENTNGLRRQYVPKGTDLSVHSAAHLQTVARDLNGRPRTTVGWISPAAALDAFLSTATTIPRCCNDPWNPRSASDQRDLAPQGSNAAAAGDTASLPPLARGSLRNDIQGAAR